MLEAIYHPNYVPDISWYKFQLLLWDRIYRIVPYSVEDEFGSFRLADRWDIPKEYVPIIGLRMPDHQYFEDRKIAIKRQLKELSKKKNNLFGEDDHFYLNTAKVPAWVGKTLNQYGLRKKKTCTVWRAKHYLVREDAADFLMSCIAHRMSMNRGMSPLTDKQVSCFATYGNQIGKKGKDQPSGESLNSLVAGVFDILVPGNIEKLSFKDVIDIREEYAQLRGAACNCLESISDEFKLNQVVNKRKADELINFALNKFDDEVKKFKKGTWRHIFKDWKVQTVATTLGMLASYIAGGPEAALALGSGSAGISIMNHIAGKDDPSNIEKTIQYFNRINQRIELNEFLEGLMNYRKLVLGKQ